jgi:membrane fusion protein (multidrug efflux system)
MTKRRKTIMTAAAVLAAAGGLALATARLWKGRGAGEEEQAARTVPRVGVQIVGRGDLVREVDVTGQIMPLAEVTVIPKITGRLDRFRLPSGELVEEGVQVRAGEVIAVLEHAALAAAVKQAQAAVEVARVTAVDAEREKRRWEALYAEKSATEQQRDKAITAFEMARAQVAQAEAALQHAEVMLEEATIEAPITGIVSRRFVDEGDMVGPNTPLVKIADYGTVKVVAAVSERHISFLRPGETVVRAAVDTFPGVVFSGTVHRVGVALDPLTRTVEIEMRLPNPDARLQPGMFARTVMALERREGVAVVPEYALLRTAEGDAFVFVADDDRVRKRSLRLGLNQGLFHEVLEGLVPGETVVVRGQRNIREGDAVETEIVEELL